MTRTARPSTASAYFPRADMVLKRNAYIQSVYTILILHFHVFGNKRVLIAFILRN